MPQFVRRWRPEGLESLENINPILANSFWELSRILDSPVPEEVVTPTRTKIRLEGDVGVYLGVGSPEGVIAAPPGSLYHQTNGIDQPIWAKYLGKGSTGWLPLKADFTAGAIYANTPPSSTANALTGVYQNLNMGITEAADPQGLWTDNTTFYEWTGTITRTFKVSISMTFIRGAGGPTTSLFFRFSQGVGGAAPVVAGLVGPEYEITVSTSTADMMSVFGFVVLDPNDTFSLMSRIGTNATINVEGCEMLIED